MKKFDIEKTVTSLQKQGVVFNSDFLKVSKSELKVPILDQMDIFLNAIDEKGLKLTTRGNLPTTLVKEITLVNPSYEEQRYIAFSKRFIEDESMSAQRARVLAKNLKFIKTSKNRLLLTPKAKAYQSLSAPEKFTILFESFLTLNLGYFDGYESFDLLNELTPLYMHSLAAKKRLYYSVDTYNTFFFENHRELEMHVSHTLLKETRVPLDKNAPDTRAELDRAVKERFSKYVQLRLFERFFALFGFIEEQGDRYNKELGEKEPYEARKTPLLDKFLNSLNVVNTDLILNKKIVHAFKETIKEKKLSIESLLYDFAYLMSTLGNYPLPASTLVVEDMIKQRMIIGTEAKNQTKLYSEFYEGLKIALYTFTQQSVAGAQRDELHEKFREFIHALYLLVDSSVKPFMIYKQFEAFPFFILELLTKEYGIVLQKGDLQESIVEHFNSDIAEDIETLFSHLSHLQKQSKKLNRVTKEYVSLLKDTIQSYILAIFSLHTYQLENRIEQGGTISIPKSDGFEEMILEFKITLNGITPEIYRVIQVPSNFTFYDLHLVIQKVFNWEDAHLFEFMIKKRIIADHEDEFGDVDIAPSREILLEEEFTRKSQKALYLYDFGDNWEHEIVLQKSFKPEEGREYPLCIDAKGNTPPEDVGGIWGFENFKEIMGDKNHHEYLEMREWYGGEYDEGECRVNILNKNFHKKK